MARRVYSEADKERFAAERREKLDAMHDQLTSAIMSLQNGQEWTSWLKFASGFHRYSFNNTVLMWSQAQLAAKPFGDLSGNVEKMKGLWSQDVADKMALVGPCRSRP